jgi:hypothetical protein
LFVKRLLFNGVEAGRMVSMNLGSPVSGEVVLSDKPAVIQGSVENDGKPFLNGHVVAVKWPVPAGVDYVDFASADVDGNGGFRIGDLASGTYRAVAVGPELWARREMRREVAGWVVGADSISVGEGESKAVRVTVKGQ